MRINLLKTYKPAIPADPDSLLGKATVISDSVIHVLDEGSKVGLRILVAYIALDTWRKVAIISAQRPR